ncbi:MAG: sulfur carrier protein ThiS, partial [Prochlorococcaceae cyanobacterium]
MAEPIALQVNGESRQATAGLSLQQLLVELGYEPRLVVVEFNGAIVPRAQWPDQPVA